MQEVQEAVFEIVTEDFILPRTTEIKGSLVTELPSEIPELEATQAFDPFANIENDMPAELRAIMIEVATVNDIIKNAKTQTKKNVYKKKIAKLQKKAKMILFTQYLSGKHLPVDSMQNSLES